MTNTVVGDADLARSVTALGALLGRRVEPADLLRIVPLASALRDQRPLFARGAAATTDAERTEIRAALACSQRTARRAAVALGLVPRARWRAPRLDERGIDQDLVRLRLRAELGGLGTLSGWGLR